jgi:hypothetical protein
MNSGKIDRLPQISAVSAVAAVAAGVRRHLPAEAALAKHKVAKENSRFPAVLPGNLC